jgi:hypothetical protein
MTMLTPADPSAVSAFSGCAFRLHLKSERIVASPTWFSQDTSDIVNQEIIGEFDVMLRMTLVAHGMR